MSIIWTSASSVAPLLTNEPQTYACTWRKCASCFAWESSSRPLQGNPDCASASHSFAFVTTMTLLLTSWLTRSRTASASVMLVAESAGDAMKGKMRSLTVGCCGAANCCAGAMLATPIVRATAN